MDEPSIRPDGFPRWLKWSLFGALGLLVLGYGAILLYANVLNDGPDAFDAADLDAALGGTASTDATSDTDTTDTTDTTDEADEAVGGVATPSTTPAAVTTESTSLDAIADGQWHITSGSEVGYRVKEVLFGVDTEAVGRTGVVSGGIEILGTQVVVATFDVDVASIESDDPRRDSQFRGRIMSADEFPLASFVLTEPIELGSLPADGVTVTTTAAGELTLRGVTNPVEFELTAQREAGRIGILGSVPVTFADYEIANPSFGGITTEDVGLVEFVLVLEPA